MVNDRTNFKTEVLAMLEQLNRNCRFFKDQVEKECNFAKEMGEKPNLRNFYIFNDMKFNSQEEWYINPVKAAEYYVILANKLLNAFLEERDTFLEIDNMPFGQIKKFDYRKEFEMILGYAELIDNNKKYFHMINEYCLKKADDLIQSALLNNIVISETSKKSVLTVPQYGALVTMDTNDINKTNSLNDSGNISYKKKILYEEPIKRIKKCIALEDRLYDIVINAKVFVTPSQNIVDYSRIHSQENVNWDAVRLIEELIHSGIFKASYFSTHHNGDREDKDKRCLMYQVLPDVDGFIGQRFHDTEHDGIRRSRSSKIERVAEELGIRPEQIVLIDDSKANCGDCKEKHGTEILYRPLTDAEIIKGEVEDTGFNRILSFDDHNLVYEYIAQAYIRAKTKTI